MKTDAQLGFSLADIFNRDNTDAVGNYYQGTPLPTPIGLADFKPGGRFFPYAVIGGALIGTALVITLARR